MWTLDQARTTYSLGQWGQGYVDMNSEGHLTVRPGGIPEAGEIDLYRLAESFSGLGLRFPVLVRFADILHDRIDRLCGAFGEARRAASYNGNYHAVYPVKVNQQRSVVEELLAHGGERVGLEAGSKPELMAVLGISQPGGVIICNGYKDRAYVRLALAGLLLGHRVILVIEKLSEMELVLEESRQLHVKPALGIRVRLASLGTGKWQNSGGEKSKFGLGPAQVLRVVGRLRTEQCLDTLSLLHCHLGSQVANLRDIEAGMREVSSFLADLREAGAPIDTVDVGGGLGIDYEGTASRSPFSVNYTLEEYARTVVGVLAEICATRKLDHPDIVTESGRAMTAHHALLITNVIDIERAPGTGTIQDPGPNAPHAIRELWQILEKVESTSAIEAYHNAVYWLRELQLNHARGDAGLEDRAQGEAIHFAICHRLRSLVSGGSRKYHDVLDDLNEKLADKYFLNLSIFQSLPDVWAIRQIFPVVPLHRLDDPPTRRAVLQDVTCDSDGRIDHYVDRFGIESTLPVHPWRPGEPYLLGIFLVGAYQEILGDMHNLFGDTDAVNVHLSGDGYQVTGPEYGDTADDLLRYVHYDTDRLRHAFREKLAATDLDAGETARILNELEAGLGGYTYFEQ